MRCPNQGRLPRKIIINQMRLRAESGLSSCEIRVGAQSRLHSIAFQAAKNVLESRNMTLLGGYDTLEIHPSRCRCYQEQSREACPQLRNNSKLRSSWALLLDSISGPLEESESVATYVLSRPSLRPILLYCPILL